jgi:haloalkane dehalogenase
MENSFPYLDDYPFRDHYIDVHRLQMHYVDEGPANANPILLLHGNPSWSYIYRKMIPPLSEKGNRVIAPDLIGFGKSQKPDSSAAHTYRNHVEWMAEFVRLLDLQQITLFGQDWGAIIGMHLAAEMPDRFRGLVLSNGVVLTGEEKLPKVLLLWRFFARYSPWIPVGSVISLGCRRKLSKEEKRAYRLPFSSRRDWAGIRAMPSLLPAKGNQNDVPYSMDLWKAFGQWSKPVLCLFSDQDPFSRGGDRRILECVPGAKGQNHKFLPGAHFIQEDAPEEIVNEINNFLLHY